MRRLASPHPTQFSMASQASDAHTTVWALIAAYPGPTNPQHSFRQNLQDLLIDGTCKLVLYMKMG